LPCPPNDDDPARGAAAWQGRLAAHRRLAHPLPAGWSVGFAPAAELDLGPGEQVEITATVLVPDPVPTPRPINVNAFANGQLAGGVTLYVHS